MPMLLQKLSAGPLAERLPLWGRSPQRGGLLALALAYGGGAWLHATHAGQHEVNELPPVWHWLRDSTLAWPLILAAVWAGILGWRALSPRLTPLRSRAALILLVGYAATAAFAAGVPVHAYLFPEAPARHGAAAVVPDADAEDDSLTHALRDGLAVLPVNLALALSVTVLIDAAAGPAARLAAAGRRLQVWLDEPAVVIRWGGRPAPTAE